METREEQNMAALDLAPAPRPDAAADETKTATDIDDPRLGSPLQVQMPTTAKRPLTPFSLSPDTSTIITDHHHNTLTPDSLVEENSAAVGDLSQAFSVGFRPLSPIVSLKASVKAPGETETTTTAARRSLSISPSDTANFARPTQIADPAGNASGNTKSADVASSSPPRAHQQVQPSSYHRITKVNPLGLSGAAQPQPQVPSRTRNSGSTTATATTATTPEHMLTIDHTTTHTSHPLSPLCESPPLFSSSVLPATKLVQPKPIAVPVSASNSISTNTPFPDHAIRSGLPVGSVAQLEATAERLSTGTSSIGDAIRELHVELKRSDSRRSSKLAASVTASNDDSASLPAVCQLKRHLSNSSSIVSTNIAARHGGYSPAGFIMSPTHSMSGRLRSGSNRSAGRPDFEPDTFLSRNGPGKSSVRSIRSNKVSLAEISESEPISLNKAALDAGEVAPPIHLDDDNDTTIRPLEQHDNQNELSSTDAFHAMLDNSFNGYVDPSPVHQTTDLPETAGHGASADTIGKDEARPATSHSHDSMDQAMDAFVDFDGVHWEPEQDWDLPTPPEEETTPVPRQGRAGAMARPQSYLDPGTGQKMLYYPARVPAMLNLPPKLSSKPKTAQRQHRQSQLLNAMAHVDQEFEETQARRRSEIPDLSRDSWLPDPLAGHRESFMALPQDEPIAQEENRVPQAETQAEAESPALRRPQRLSRNELDPRKSRADNNLPPQLRASVYFDMPSESTKVEMKDGSAMATLDSMLDASMSAPVGAFTDHSYAGKLGSEVYGKENKRKSKLSLSAPAPPVVAPQPPTVHKKRSSLFWFRRSTSYNSEKSDADKSAAHGGAPLGSVNGELNIPATRPLTSSVDGDSIRDRDRDHREGSVSDGDNQEENSGDEDADDYNGPPTTLLAELQLRKQQQKQRTQPLSRQFPNGMHATLLEMDAVAEVERKNRKGKRVNLAWEAPDAHLDQNGSDDEDVPLAVIAAKHQGAKNMADLERPIGLMEKREMEDNEPLSHRKARLQGLDPMSMVVPKRRSLAVLSAHIQSNIRPPSAQMPRSPIRTPELESEPMEEEIEEETLAERKRRLEAKELPKTRPVSSSFSAELLSQFGDLDDAARDNGDNNSKENPGAVVEEAEEETLAQRRARLHAEKQAREREMSYGNLVGQPVEPVQQVNRRLSLADMLSAHPKKEGELRVLAERQRAEQEAYAAREREAKMAAMRRQMPQTLTGPNITRSGGFNGGAFNNGRGGAGQLANHPTTQGFQNRNQSTATFSAYGMPVQQNAYAPATPQYGHYAPMGGYPNNYGNTYPYAHQQPVVQMQMQMPENPPTLNRVEQWRHGVVP